MAVSPKVVRKYATTIFFVAKESNKVDKVSKDLDLILSISQKFQQEFEMINNPVYPDSVRLDFIDKLQRKNKFHSITYKFLNVLASKKRLNIISDIVKMFHELKYEAENIEKVEVVSVKELSQTQIKSIEKFFSKNMQKKVWVENIVDKNIIGGTMIKVGSMIFDNSIASKVRKMKFFVEDIKLSEH